MKTSIQTTFSTRLSQSEAMLKAIQAGFFEAFLEKNEVKKVFVKRNCQTIRLHFSLNSNGQAMLVASSVSSNGQQSLLASRKLTCSQNRNQMAVPYSVDFASGELYQLLAQPDCTGLRFFPGILSDSRPTLIAVAVESKGFDMADGPGYLQSQCVTKN